MEVQAQEGLNRLEALEASRGLAPTPKNIDRIAAVFGQEAASWAFNQWTLRKRASAKFADASEMLFTSDALEQASHEDVAAYHASRFPKAELVADLTTGIGSDLRALAARGPALGFEIDPIAAEFAAQNSGCEVRLEDCLQAEWDFEYAFADPARRSQGKRMVDPQNYSPNPVELATRMRKLTFAGMKLSPMLADEFLTSISPSAEFVSYGWECRESIAWFGEGAAPGISARRIEDGATLDRSSATIQVKDPMDFLYEADPAAIRAHCLGTLCEIIDGAELGDSNGYLTSSKAVESPWLRRYRVLEFGSFDIKRVRASLAAHGGGSPEVKSRIGTDVAALRKKLAQKGEGTPIVALYPVKKSIRYSMLEKT